MPGIGKVREEDFLTCQPALRSMPRSMISTWRWGVRTYAIETVVEYLLPLLQSRGDIVPCARAERRYEVQTRLPGMNGHGRGAGLGSLPIDMDGKSSVQKRAAAGVSWRTAVALFLAMSIVGFFNPGKGMFVHRSDCRALRRQREQARDTLVEVNWLQIEPQQYLAPITIVARDRAGLLRDVAAVVSDAGINMTAVTSTTNASSQKAVITATLEIEAVEQIDRIFKRLRQVKNVVSVNRIDDPGEATGLSQFE